jgi:hypothetical protein
MKWNFDKTVFFHVVDSMMLIFVLVVGRLIKLTIINFNQTLINAHFTVFSVCILYNTIPIYFFKVLL